MFRHFRLGAGLARRAGESVDSSLVADGFQGIGVMSDTETGGVSVTTRAARAEDEEFLFALYASTRRDEMAVWGWPAAQQEMFLRMQYRALQQRYAAERDLSDHRIILRDEVPVGRLLVVRSADEIRLADIALLPEHRRLGIGAALIGGLQDEAARRGLPLRLHVARDNHDAARLYQRLGFIIKGDTGSHFKMEWLPAAASEL
ncbi:MAG TPA: GNAT family N-acetyltransferase [Blastocatellia bacterium]|nr:GNAT family N-acetyltransferase [Blastocatellia bacterium]